MLSHARMIVAVSLTVTFAAGCHRSERPLSICELLSKLDRYKGRQIAVRGIYYFTTHGAYLAATSDYDGSCREVEKQGHTWPSGIRFGGGLDWSRVLPKLEEARRLQRLHDATKGMEPLVIVATFTGIVETKDNLQIVRREDGSYHGNGYGAHGRFPALLIPSDVQDAMTRPERGIIVRNLGLIIVITGFVTVFLLYFWHCRRLERERSRMRDI